MLLKKIINDYFPPAVVRFLKRQNKNRIKFSGNYSSWRTATENSSGYDQNNILKKVLEGTLKVVKGDAAFERDSMTFDTPEYSWPLIAVLAGTAAQSEGRLDVLDFGGSLGSSYFQNIKFLEKLPYFKWNIVEQDHFVKAGQDNVQNKSLSFYSDIENCLLENRPNAIVLSSVLQYLENPEDLLKKIDIINAKTLIIDRTPVSDQPDDKIVVQHVPPSIYEASYPMRIFSKVKLMHLLSSKWELMSENLCADGVFLLEKGFEFSFKGFYFERK